MKTYTLENVNYSFNRNSRKWHFVIKKSEFVTFEFIFNCPGGKATADAVVKQILASARRNKKDIIDGLARHAISQICKK